ncbi:FHA domain-containing protein [Larkinella insperata]|uniref:FHA domain-containing protein n=1 Tax=Larkinella insperata TaxID=332158 RepID=A0ABW3QNZ6_9BACT
MGLNGFKLTLINCQSCGRRIMVRAADAERGSIRCTHVGCGAENALQTTLHYDDAIVKGLPEFGYLTYLGEPKVTYPLQFGPNVIGTSESCTIKVERFIHEGRCFISRRHCTLTVTFDQWSGKLRYQIQDGTREDNSPEVRYSLNGTYLNDSRLQKMELIDLNHEGVVTLGGVDRFRLTHYFIPPAMLNTYRVELAFNPDRTE